MQSHILSCVLLLMDQQCFLNENLHMLEKVTNVLDFAKFSALKEKLWKNA